MFVVPEILHSCSIHTFLLYNSEVGGQKQTSEPKQDESETDVSTGLKPGNLLRNGVERIIYYGLSLEPLDTILN